MLGKVIVARFKEKQGSKDGHEGERGGERERERLIGSERGFHAGEEQAQQAGIAGMPTSAGKAVTPGGIAVELSANPADKPSTSSGLNPNPVPLNPKS
jgi:hypothetical protein